MKALIFALLFLASDCSIAQFHKVNVVMQSGSTVPIMELPWFQYQISLYQGQHKDKAITADWIVYSPPKYCPISAWYYLRWQGKITAEHHAKTKQQCDERMSETKLANLPTEVKNICSCELVLKTLNVSEDGAIWQSYNDELLNDDSFKIAADLTDNNGKELPVLLTLAAGQAGVYSFDGTALCVYNGKFVSNEKNALNRLYSILKSPNKKSIPIKCLPEREGAIDLSDISFSFLAKKITGSPSIKFNSGESYSLKIRQ